MSITNLFINLIAIPSIFLFASCNEEHSVDELQTQDSLIAVTQQIAGCFFQERPEKLMLKRIHQDGYFITYGKIPDSIYQSFTTKELLFHALFYPESYSQVCSLFGTNQDYIYSYVSAFGLEQVRSQRQDSALHEHRDEVLQLLEECMAAGDYGGDQSILLLWDMQFWELTPYVLKWYDERKEFNRNDNLSLVLLWMKEDQYTPFLNSPYRALFYDDAGDLIYGEQLIANPENVAGIKKLAMDYYEWKKGQQ